MSLIFFDIFGFEPKEHGAKLQVVAVPTGRGWKCSISGFGLYRFILKSGSLSRLYLSAGREGAT